MTRPAKPAKGDPALSSDAPPKNRTVRCMDGRTLTVFDHFHREAHEDEAGRESGFPLHCITRVNATVFAMIEARQMAAEAAAEALTMIRNAYRVTR